MVTPLQVHTEQRAVTAITRGGYDGMAFFGTGGTDAQMEVEPGAPKYRISCGPSNAAPNMQAEGFDESGDSKRQDDLILSLRSELEEKTAMLEEIAHSSSRPNNCKYCDNIYTLLESRLAKIKELESTF